MSEINTFKREDKQLIEMELPELKVKRRQIKELQSQLRSFLVIVEALIAEKKRKSTKVKLKQRTKVNTKNN